jgi:hypothetical protein
MTTEIFMKRPALTWSWLDAGLANTLWNASQTNPRTAFERQTGPKREELQKGRTTLAHAFPQYGNFLSGKKRPAPSVMRRPELSLL